MYQRINRFLTKKNVLSIGLVYLIAVYVFAVQPDGPRPVQFLWGLTGGDTLLVSLFFPILAIVILTGVIYFLNDEVFSFWIIFASIGAFITAMITMMIPHHNSGALSLDQKPLYAIVVNVLFTLVSVLIIITKTVLVYRGRRG